MSEFLGNYGFFIVIALFMVICHLGHGGHGGHGRRDEEPVEFLPTKPGEYEFACKIGMFRGRLIVEP